MKLFRRTDCKTCKSVDKKLYLKGDRCFSTKCPFEKISKVKSQTFVRSNQSLYKIQILEKRKVRHIYKINTRIIKKYLMLASRKENVNDFFIYLLESRLDNVLYRAGFAFTRSSARLKISHGFITVNGKKHNISSYNVKEGDRINISLKDEVNRQHILVPDWIKNVDETTIIIDKFSIKNESILFDVKSVIGFLTK